MGTHSPTSEGWTAELTVGLWKVVPTRFEFTIRAIVIRTPCPLGHANSHSIFCLFQGTWSLEREKLFSILSLKPQEPSPPLLILALNWPESQDESTLIDGLELRRLQDNNLCSSYDILGITDTICGSELNEKVND